MATSSATAPVCDFKSSPQRDNFMRLTRLLIAGGTPVLRNVLKKYHTPQTLARKLASTRIGFTKPQKQRVFPPDGVFPPSGLPNFEQFDISLIFKLLRNCCGELTEPGTKWNELPQERDFSLEADIVRIDLYRNEIHGHTLEDMALTDDEFEKYWENISGALLRLANSVSEQTTDAQLSRQIVNLRYSFLTAQDKHMVMQYLCDIRSSLEHQDEKLEIIEAKEDKITQGIEGIQDTMFHAASALHDLKISDNKTLTTAASPTVQYNTNIVFYNTPDARGTTPTPRRPVSEGSNEMPHNQKTFNKSISLPSNEVGLRPLTDDYNYGFQETARCSQAHHPDESYTHFPSDGQTDKTQDDVFQNLSYGEYQQETPKYTGNQGNVPFDVGNREGTFGFESANQISVFDPGRLTAATQGGNAGARPKIPSSVNQSFSSSPRHQDPYASLEEDDSLLRIYISLPHAGLDDFHLGHVMQSLLAPLAEESEMYQFYSYLKKRRQLTIRNVDGNQNEQDCFIDVTPRDLKSLEDLWHDYIMNDIREFVKETVLPEDFRGEVEVHIDSKQYERCCKSLRPREFKDSGKQLHSQSFSQVTDISDIPTQETHARMPRSKSMVQLPNAQQNTIEELFLVICKNGGRMKLQDAKNQLSYASGSELDKQVFRHKMTEHFKFLPDGFIQAKVKLQFCPKKRKDSACEDAKCPDLHLCSYQFLSRCAFSQKCKNSHDICDRHTDNVFKMSSLSSLSTNERLKLLKNLAYAIPEICIYYNKSSCKKNMQCTYLHVCKYWIKGKCAEVYGCKRAHSFGHEHEREILKKNNLDKLSEKDVLEKLNDHYKC